MSLSIFKQRLFLGLGLAALSSLHLSVATAEEPQKAPVSVEVPFEKYTLDNGLEVVAEVNGVRYTLNGV